jgi:uncharacterized protein YcbK (DUF882 family)
MAMGLSLVSPLDLFAKHLPAEKNISFYHTHTQERFDLCYIEKSCPVSIKRSLHSFLRDFRTGDVHPIDFRLMDILWKIQKKTGSKGVYEVISGYRSPHTNQMLYKKSNGVSQKSFHLKGQAIDIRLTDLSTRDLRDAAISLKAGGVGYYASSDFVHVDTGRVRTW